MHFQVGREPELSEDLLVCSKQYSRATLLRTHDLAAMVESNNSEERLARIDDMIRILDRESAALKRRGIPRLSPLPRPIEDRGRRTEATLPATASFRRRATALARPSNPSQSHCSPRQPVAEDIVVMEVARHFRVSRVRKDTHLLAVIELTNGRAALALARHLVTGRQRVFVYDDAGSANCIEIDWATHH